MNRMLNQSHKPNRTALVQRSLVALLLTASVAGAQVRQIQQNNPLDANPQVGGGGSNQPVQGYVPVNGNDIMTGNVTGLGYFHGSVPYSSTLQFGSNAKAGSFSSFLARSTGGYNPPVNTGRMQTFYVQSKMVSADSGRISPGLIAPSTLSGLGVTLVGPGTVNPTNAYGANSFGRGKLQFAQNALSNDFTNLSQPPGVNTQDTDPLFGLKRNMQFAALPEIPDSFDPNSDSQGWSPELKKLGTPGVRNPNREPDPNEPARTDLGATDLVNQSVETKPINDRVIMPETGQTLNTLPPASLDPNNITVSENFQGTMELLRKNTSANKNYNEPGGITQFGVIPDGTRYTFGTNPQQKPKSEPTPALDPLTGKPRKSDKPERSPNATNFDNPASADNPFPNRGTPDKTPMGKSPDSNAGATEPPGRPGTHTGTTTHTPPGTPKEAPRVPNSLAVVLQKADKELVDGQYLQAADIYQSALRMDPGNQPAVIGRATAELAAGMYESAAFDLKFLYTEYPEQISTHHPLTKSISAKRLAYLEKDLLALSRKKSETPAAFLLAYLYYQTNKPAELQTTLHNWQQRWPTDTWPKVFNKAWMEGTQPVVAPSTEPATSEPAR